jgi:hypothetical protein
MFSCLPSGYCILFTIVVQQPLSAAQLRQRKGWQTAAAAGAALVLHKNSIDFTVTVDVRQLV